MNIDFFQKAKVGRNDWYFYVITIGLVALGYLLFSSPIGLLIYSQDLTPAEINNIDKVMWDLADKNLVLTLVCLPFLGVLLALFFGIRFLHQKKITSVLTGALSIRWGRVVFAFCVILGFHLLTVFMQYKFVPDDFIVQFDAQKFIILVLVAFVFLGIQATTEELLIRGYLTQGIGLLFNSRLVALILPTLIFAALHMMNPEVQEHGWQIMFPAYAGMGLIFAIMTLMDDGTELAIGCHVGNNIAIALLVSSPEAVLQTYSILRLKEAQQPEGTLLQIFIFGAIFITLFAIRYKWNNWSKLWGRIN